MSKEYLDRLAPCGLHCGKCFAFAGGDINRHSAELKKNLGNFRPYAERFSVQLDEVFEVYPQFEKMLNYFSDAECGGCRKEKCKFYKNCKVRACSEEKQVEFCFECSEFPCDHTGLDENLYRRHVAINERIREIGAEAYYQEIKDKPRY